MKKIICILMLFVAPVALAGTKLASPYQVKPQTKDWLCGMNTADFAQVDLTDRGLLQQTKVDPSKTKIQMLLKKDFGGSRFEQVFYITLHQTDGKVINFIAESTTESDGECPGSSVKIFVVSQELGKYPSLNWVFPPKS